MRLARGIREAALAAAVGGLVLLLIAVSGGARCAGSRPRPSICVFAFAAACRRATRSPSSWWTITASTRLAGGRSAAASSPTRSAACARPRPRSIVFDLLFAEPDQAVPPDLARRPHRERRRRSAAARMRRCARNCRRSRRTIPTPISPRPFTTRAMFILPVAFDFAGPKGDEPTASPSRPIRNSTRARGRLSFRSSPFGADAAAGARGGGAGLGHVQSRL